MAASGAPIWLVLTLLGEFGIFWPELGLAALRAVFSIGSSDPLQKFSRGSLLFSRLPSWGQVLRRIWVGPP